MRTVAPTERRHGADPARPHPLWSRNGGVAKGVERAEGGERATASGSGRGEEGVRMRREQGRVLWRFLCAQ
jgi:hypothetical protein